MPWGGFFFAGRIVPDIRNNSENSIDRRGGVHMLGITHAAVGMAVGCLVGNPADAFVCGVTALLPDIDEPNSTIGRRVPLVSSLVNLALGHRGYTHTLIFAAGVAGAVGLAFGWHYALMSFVGILLHILTDCATVSGCMPFLPFSKKRIRGTIKTGTLPDHGIAFACLIVFFVRLTGRF